MELREFEGKTASVETVSGDIGADFAGPVTGFFPLDGGHRSGP